MKQKVLATTTTINQSLIPPKVMAKKNLGTVICINPNCIGKRYGYIGRSRDANTSMNRIVTGLHQQHIGSAPAVFSRSSTSVSSGINKLVQELKSSHPDHPMVEVSFPVP